MFPPRLKGNYNSPLRGFQASPGIPEGSTLPKKKSCPDGIEQARAKMLTLVRKALSRKTQRPKRSTFVNRGASQKTVHKIGALKIGVLILPAALSAFGAPPGCVGSQAVARFRVFIRPFSKGAQLPLKSVAEIPAGAHLVWDPVHLAQQTAGTAEVAAVLVPASDAHLITLAPRKAAISTEWQLLERPQVIAMIFGPQGLSEGKVQSLVEHDSDLLRELADYAEQSSQVETLVQQLTDAEQSGGSTDAVLKGFSAQYGTAATKLDTRAPSNQQAALLLKALLPASGTYDPLATRDAQVQQSGGVAASVAAMFFGNPVLLASGGAALFQNLKTALFPSTDFRSAFAQADANDSLALCTKATAAKTKTRSAYLWAYRVPENKRPLLSLEGTPHLPLGSKSVVALKHGSGSSAKQMVYARDWRLLPVSGGAAAPVAVRFPSEGSLELDLSKVHAAGDYHLEATWDWSPLTVAGTLHLEPYPDFAHISLARGEHDRLVEGRGRVSVELTGANFEFLDKASLEPSTAEGKPIEEAFTLPQGKRAGEQDRVRLSLDTSKAGAFRLLLAQSDGVEHQVPITILPPNPKISNCPIRVNLGEARQAIHLEGAGVERIESISSEAGEITGALDGRRWKGLIALKPGIAEGQRFSVLLKVQGLDTPVSIPDAIEVVAPRPRIQSVRKSLAGELGIDLGPDELPAGTAVGLVLSVDHLHTGARPRLDLACEEGAARQPLTLTPGEPSSHGALAFAGPGALYLSIDPGVVGYAGCRLSATLAVEPEGRSDPVTLGRVIRIPRLDRFTLTTEKLGDSSYAGILEGRDLDVIDKTGWDAEHGGPVQSIPVPAPGDPGKQTLRIALPWPAPAPHAPLYVWLRGETTGRKTTVVY